MVGVENDYRSKRILSIIVDNLSRSEPSFDKYGAK